MQLSAARNQAHAELEQTQKVLWSALKTAYTKLGLPFTWPKEDFVDTRRAALKPFLSAIATELCKPSGKLDISDSLAIDEVIERMYMVGLMHTESAMKQFEAPHMKALIQYFRVFHLDNNPKITTPGVRVSIALRLCVYAARLSLIDTLVLRFSSWYVVDLKPFVPLCTFLLPIDTRRCCNSSTSCLQERIAWYTT